ncbi:MAG TPA: molybdopterin molybdenumtransferase MoeA, partial [Zunongwangia profunda]|nr:molybdopterin molybdenumtransferase MoeA [Zunongwangia profunda]
FVNYHIYFIKWLTKSLELEDLKSEVILNTAVDANSNITRYLLVKTNSENGEIKAELLNENGSGDLISLANADGVIILPPEKDFEVGDLVEFVSF